MKSFFYMFILLYTLMSFTPQNKVSLNVVVSGIENNKGSIFLALYSNATNFPKKKVGQYGGSIVSEPPTMSYLFKDIPVGTYAIAIFHDENNDKKLNANLLGVPIEGYGFSNNVSGVFGPPKFKNASIELVQNKEITIQLKY